MFLMDFSMSYLHNRIQHKNKGINFLFEMEQSW